MKAIVSFTALVILANTAMAAVPKNILQTQGALQGGQSGTITSLLDIRKSIAKNKKTERLVVDIGDAATRKLKGRLGYYTVELRQDRQLVLNFNQTLTSKFDEKQLRQKLNGSLFVSSSKMVFDPTSQTTSLILNLKKPIAIKVLGVGGSRETGKLVIDMQETRAKAVSKKL